MILRQLFWKLIIRRVARLNDRLSMDDLKSPAIIFSPHFDDETLGCSGIIAQKAKAGADIKIAFITDGSTSHRHLMDGKKLTPIRTAEGLAAAETLGIKPDNVIFFNAPDGQLLQHEGIVSDKIRLLLQDFKPAEVYLPHASEPLLWSQDHLVTHKLVKAESLRSESVKSLMEYPVWYWFHWPWIAIRLRQRQINSIIVKQTVRCRFGWNSIFDFNCHVNISDFLSLKEAALIKHKSQTTQLIQDDRWATLYDVADGDFVKCFFRSHELFRRTLI